MLQFSCCTSKSDNNSLKIDALQSIANQIQQISGVRLNIIGGNIFKYSEIRQIPIIFSDKKESIHYWFHYSNFQPNIIDFNACFEVLIDIPVNMESLYSCVKQLPSASTTFHFIVNSVKNVELAQSIISKLLIENFEFHPFYDGTNKDFFENNIFLSHNDIIDEIISQRKIFCNQAINTNFFGKLNILPDGDVFANISAEKLGNIDEHTILQLIYQELEKNTAWRKTRIEHPCCKCLYQYLCPPVSNYELILNQLNLCTILASTK